MPTIIEKVTIFVLRSAPTGAELLLFAHPYAGIQIPAGTVEPGESPAAAALREAGEETGLSDFSALSYLGCEEVQLPEAERIIAVPTHVYARPDTTSFDWAYIRSGITVRVERAEGAWRQITYAEFDQTLDPEYVTLCITGWVPDEVLADVRRRHFFLTFWEGSTELAWVVETDNHRFELFWAPLAALPAITSPQDAWVEKLRAAYLGANPGKDGRDGEEKEEGARGNGSG